MKDYRMPVKLCPKCGYTMDGASNMSGKGKPDVGDFSLCINCGALLRFGPGFTLKIAEDMSDVHPIDRLKIMAAREFIRQRGPLKHDTKH